MAYTSTDLIRRRLPVYAPLGDRVYDQAITLDGDDYRAFYGAAVESGSVNVKSYSDRSPVRTRLTLIDGSTSLNTSLLRPHSVVVASDSSLGHVYEENVDFAIDYSQGRLVIKPGGGLDPGQTISVWYRSYRLYEAGQDYDLDESRGRIRRRAGGKITSGERVYLDYSPVFGSFDDSVLAAAVAEANGTVAREVDPSGEFGADPTLQAAATYRALDIVCRSAACLALSRNATEERAALAWLSLADGFDARAERLLADFRPSATGPKPPVTS